MLALCGVSGLTEISSTGDYHIESARQYSESLTVDRSGIDKNTGTHWLRVEQPKDSKVVFKQIEVEDDLLVATDKDNNVFYKMGYNKDIKGKNNLKLPLKFIFYWGSINLDISVLFTILSN